jgi:transposase InsO family protein
VTAHVHLIADESGTSVSAVCRVLGVPRSTVYARRARRPSKRAKETAALDVAVRAVHAQSERRYGSPRVHRELRRAGYHIARKRVAMRMRVLGLVARRPKRFRRTTDADPTKVPAPNVLARRFDGWRPDRAWVGDITYIWTLAGWAYLAILVDLGTRAIVGWAVSRRCDSALALRALNAAIARRRPSPGLLHHTDRGSTYTADNYQARLRELGMRPSMSRKGDCWDNAVAESTIGTIKTELLGEQVPESIHDVRRILFPYIEGFYNRRRLHSSLGYMTPTEAYALACSDSKIVA